MYSPRLDVLTMFHLRQSKLLRLCASKALYFCSTLLIQYIMYALCNTTDFLITVYYNYLNEMVHNLTSDHNLELWVSLQPNSETNHGKELSQCIQKKGHRTSQF